MMTLTTEYGEFSGETEAEVLKAAGAAKRKAAKDEKEREASAEHATLLACRHGLFAYQRVHEGNRYHWELFTPGSEWFPQCARELCHNVYAIDGGTLKLYDAHNLVGIVWNGGGETVLVFVETPEGDILSWAIAVHNGVMGHVDVPGVPMEFFRAEATG